jgi:hypothetical protein
VLLQRLTAPRRAQRFASAAAALDFLNSPWVPVAPRSKGLRLALLGAAALLVAGAAAAARLSARELPSAPAPAQGEAEARKEWPAVDPALMQQQTNTLKAYFVAEKSFFAEQDRYSADLKALYTPDDWCPDGARQRTEQPPVEGELASCNFFYGVRVEGHAPQQTFLLYSRGAVEGVLDRVWVTVSDGPTAGRVEEWPIDRLFLTLQKEKPPRPAVAPPSQGSKQLPEAEAELVKERLTGLRGLRAAELSYFAERDAYAAEFPVIGFKPDAWCPDGARLRQTAQASQGEAAGCHYLYGVFLEGKGPEGSFTAYARGAIAPVAGKVWLVSSAGPASGIPQEVSEGELERRQALASARR